MTSDKDAMEKAAEQCGGYTYDHGAKVIAFKAGWQAALNGPAVTALVEALYAASFDRYGYCTNKTGKEALAEFEKLKEIGE
jgi:hypothetical protein